MKRFLPFVLVVATLGCNVDGLDFDNVEGPTVNTSAAIPIGYAHYTIRELIDEINDAELDLQEDSTSLLFMIYRDTVDFSNGSDIVDIPDVVNQATYDVAGTGTFTTSFDFTYEAANSEPIDSVFYSGGTVEATVTGSFTNSFTYTLTIGNTRNVSTDAAVVLTDAQPSQSLVGHKTDLDRDTVNNLNTFVADFDITVQPGGSIGPGDFVTVTIQYLDQEFSIIYGKFGKDEIEFEPQILDIKLFENLGNSGLEFGNPTLSFEFENGFGLPLGIFFGGLYSVKGSDVTYLEGDITESPTGELIAGAVTPGSPENTLIEINRSNSSLVEMLNNSPDQMGFEVTALTNPVDSTSSNFVEGDAQIRAFIEMNLPMEVRLNDLSRNVNFKLGSGLNFNAADSLSIRVVTVNEIPLYVLADIEILDANDSIIYSVANNAIISTPFLNIDGSLKEARKTITDIPVSPAGIDALNDGRKLRMKTLLNSPKSRTGNDIYVKILADYEIDIQVSVLGTLNVDL